ncbi:MAG: hypothetical protein HY608_03360 [Planctomycetes bacterium]|nr:hypothetical protein [Planctomycetota bacterium]
MRSVLSLLLVMVCLGCSSAPSSAVGYLRAHPDLPLRIALALRDGVLVAGMSEAEVTALLGAPTHRTHAVGDADEVVSWSYPAGRTVAFRAESGAVRRFARGALLDFSGGLLDRARESADLVALPR